MSEEAQSKESWYVDSLLTIFVVLNGGGCPGSIVSLLEVSRAAHCGKQYYTFALKALLFMFSH